jgi:hypothetical protein
MAHDNTKPIVNDLYLGVGIGAVGSALRHGWTIGVVSVSSQSGHSVGEDVRYKASGIAFINAMIFRMDCLVVRIPSAAEV